MRHWIHLAPYAPLLTLLLWAAIGDYRTRLIRNWLTLSLMVSGLLQSFLPAATVSPSSAALGLLAGFGLLLIPFILNAIGGGDIKLLAGIGAWVGVSGVFQIFLIESVVGLLIVLCQASAAGKIRSLFQNSAVLVVNLVHVGTLGIEHAETTGRACTSIDRPLPYAVPTLVATVLFLFFTLVWGIG